MAIKYEFYRNPDSQGSKRRRYHARVVPCGRVSTDQLAKEIQKESSLTVSDVKSVLIALADKMGNIWVKAVRFISKASDIFKLTFVVRKKYGP